MRKQVSQQLQLLGKARLHEMIDVWNPGRLNKSKQAWHEQAHNQWQQLATARYAKVAVFFISAATSDNGNRAAGFEAKACKMRQRQVCRSSELYLTH